MKLVMTQGRKGQRLRSQDKKSEPGWPCTNSHCGYTANNSSKSWKLFLSSWNLVASALARTSQLLRASLLSLEQLRYRHLLGRPALCWAREIVQVSFPCAWFGSGSQVWLYWLSVGENKTFGHNFGLFLYKYLCAFYMFFEYIYSQSLKN